MTQSVDPRRVRMLNRAPMGGGPVVYWMSRDQRAGDNWALLFARELARENRRPLAVVFCLAPRFLKATVRQYAFMLEGLRSAERELADREIPFFLLAGEPPREIIGFARRHGVGALVADFDPLRVKRRWKAMVARALDAAFYEVDAHNVVPCWEASPRQEYAAYTLRPRINRTLVEFSGEFPRLTRLTTPWPGGSGPVDWRRARDSLEADTSVPVVAGPTSGSAAGRGVLDSFLQNRLTDYAARSNDPNADAQSGLSPYLHFGQISAQRVLLETIRADAPVEAKESFVEQLLVRRELSDNFCYYNTRYDSFEGFPEWARKTLNDHRGDPRPYLYGRREFERAETHDALWNAAQAEMVLTGKMHGYLRMYWAKKILEWSESPERALKTAIYLNDRYELDGRDPNGYTGIAWSIGGVHDRAWAERRIFGKIRYMSHEGMRRKFDVDRYVRRVASLVTAPGGAT